MTLGPNYFTRIQSKDFLRHWKSSDEHGANAFGPRYEGHRGKNRICCCSFLWGRGQVDAYTDHHRPIDRSDRSDEIMISQFISILFSLIGCLVTNSCPMMIATSNLCSSSGFFHAHKIAEKNEKRVFPKKTLFSIVLYCFFISYSFDFADDSRIFSAAFLGRSAPAPSRAWKTLSLASRH